MNAPWPFETLEAGAYHMISADPPWRFQVRSRETGLRKAADLHYSTMTLDDIKYLPVSSLAAPDCLLWLWCTAPMMHHGMDVLQAWGFAYKSMAVWHKKTKTGKTHFGTGFRFRNACEFIILGARGHPKNTRGVRNLIEGVVREHSRKPDEAYAAAERLMPEARRVDLFARERRPGWDAWGLEVEKFGEKDALSIPPV